MTLLRLHAFRPVQAGDEDEKDAQREVGKKARRAQGEGHADPLERKDQKDVSHRSATATSAPARLETQVSVPEKEANASKKRRALKPSFAHDDAPSAVTDISAGRAAPTVTAVRPRKEGEASEKVAALESSTAHEGAPMPAAASAPAVETAEAAGDWATILAALIASGLGGMARELAQHCVLRQADAAEMTLALAPEHRHLLMKPALDKLQQALDTYYGRVIRLHIDVDAVAGDTPAAAAQKRKQARQAKAEAAIAQDAFVREAIDLFDATLVASSIKPV